MPICAKRREIAQPVLTMAILRPAKTAAMCMACHEYTCPPPAIPLFMLMLNLFSKRTAATMQPSCMMSAVVIINN